MKKFIKEVLSDETGPSSKRVMMFMLLVAFLLECSYNIITGHSASQTLQDQLFYILEVNLGVVFGSNVANVIKDIKSNDKQ